jgi:DnaJ like chaperone protein
MATSTQNGGTPGPISAVIRDFRTALGDLFGGGRLEPEQETSVQVIFGLLGYLAGADSIVTTHEAEFTNQLMDEFDLSTRARDLAHIAFARGRKREIDVETEVRRYLLVHPKGSPEVERLYDALLQLAAADGRLRPGERAMLEQVTKTLGFSPETLNARLGG